MHIVVCLKQVPDTNEVRIDSQTNNLIRQGVPSIINPYDLTGLKIALALRDENGGSVTVLSMGLMQGMKDLEYCLALGADRAILLSDKRLGGSDTLATGYALAQTIAKLNFELIICGLEAIDGSTAQVGPSIAANLGIPQCTYVSDIVVQDGQLKIRKETQEYIEEYFASFPLLITVHKNAKFRSIVNAKTTITKQVEIWNSDHLDEGKIGFKGSATKVVSISTTNGNKDYLYVDSSLSAEERIDYIISGGMNTQRDIHFVRGNHSEMAKEIIAYLNNGKFADNGGLGC
jgi:electron transfer flavoprotein beta subunit